MPRPTPHLDRARELLDELHALDLAAIELEADDEAMRELTIARALVEAALFDELLGTIGDLVRLEARS